MKKLVISVLIGGLAIAPMATFASDEVEAPVLTQTEQKQRLQQHLDDGSGQKAQTMTQSRTGEGSGTQAQKNHQYKYKKGDGQGTGQKIQTKKQLGKNR